MIITAEQQIWTPKNDKGVAPNWSLIVLGRRNKPTVYDCEIGDRYVDDYETIWAEKRTRT